MNEQEIPVSYQAYYQLRKPKNFIRDVLGVKTWDGQDKIIESFEHNRKTSVASGNALGKDYIGSALVLSFLYNYYPSIVITTATTSIQVEKVIWGEIAEKWHGAKYPLGGELLTKQIIVDRKMKWYAIGFTTKDVKQMTGRFQGFHSPNVMVLFSEAQAIEHGIWEQAETLATSENFRWLALGNPLINYGDFYDTFQPGSGWSNIHLDCRDSPNFREKRDVVPGMASYRWGEEMLTKYGEKHPIYVMKVTGRFAGKQTDAFIDPLWLAWANQRGLELIPAVGKKIVACDPAAGGTNKTVITSRTGMRVTDVEKHEKKSTMETAGILVIKLKEGADEVRIDVTGIGQGIYDRMVELGFKDKVFAINFGAKPINDPRTEEDPKAIKNTERYANLGTQMYAQFAKAIEDRHAGFALDTDLSIQLLNRKMMTLSNGKLRLESKDDFLARGFESPDEADSMVMCYLETEGFPGHTKAETQEEEDAELDAIWE